MSDETVTMPIYLTKRDREVIREAAKELGNPTASDLVRAAISDYLIKNKLSPISDTVSKRRGGNRRVIEQSA